MTWINTPVMELKTTTRGMLPGLDVLRLFTLLLLAATLLIPQGAQALTNEEVQDWVARAQASQDRGEGEIPPLIDRDFNFTATDSILETGVLLSWPTDPDLEVYYEILRNDIPIMQLSAQDSVYLDTDVQPLRTYDYTLLTWALWYPDDPMVYSGDVGTPGFFQPRNAWSTQYSDLGGVQFGWEDRSSIETGYIIYRDGVAIDSTAANTIGYYDTTAEPLTSYEYCASAYYTSDIGTGLVGSYPTPGVAQSIELFGTTALIADGTNGLEIVDVSNPANPTFISNFPAEDTFNDVYVHGQWALVADGTFGLKLIEWEYDPENPWEYASQDTDGEALGVFGLEFGPWDETLLLVADGTAGLAVAMITEGLDEFAYYDTPGIAYNAVADNDGIAYVADGAGDLQVLDASDYWGVGVSFITSLTLPGEAMDIVVEGDYALIAAGSAGLVVVDISNPAIPVMVANIDGGGLLTNSTDIALSGTRAYLSDASGIVAIFDVSNPPFPILSGTVDQTNPGGLAVLNDQLHIAADGDYNILDIPVDIATGWTCSDGIMGTIEPPTDIAASYGIYLDKTVISWTDNSSFESGFRIIRTPDALSVDVDPNVVMWEDTDAGVLGVEQTYEVWVLDANGNPLLGGSAAGIYGPDTMLPPTDLVVSQRYDFDDRIRVTWTDAPSEDFYVIWRFEIGFEPAVIDTIVAGETSYDDFDVAAETSYAYHVTSASDAGGTSLLPYGDMNVGQRDDILAPINVVATDGEIETHVKLTWENRSSKTVYFRLSRDGEPFQTIAGAHSEAFDLGAELDLYPGVTYTYTVEAVSAEGLASGNSDDGYRELLPPTDVAAEDEVSEARVLVTWASASQAETGYNIYRALADAPVDTTLIGSVGVNNAAYLDETGSSDVEYTYFVATHDDLGESVRDSDNGIRRLIPPVNVSATDGAYEDQVVITWMDDSGAEDGFRIRRDGASLGVVTDGSLTFTDDDSPAIGTVYSYTVETYDSYGPSLTTADDGGAAMLPPSSMSASTEYDTGVYVSWTDDSALNTGYYVTRDGTNISGSLGGSTITYFDSSVPDEDLEYEYCVVATSGGAETTPVCDTGMMPSSVSAATNTAGFISDLTASDLIYDNRVRLEWTDAGGSEDGFRVYRDDLLIETLDPDSQSYNDFDAAPGSVHEYRVEGFNASFSGWETDMGWRPADGGIAGRVTTLSGAPVEGVDIGLDPTPNQALLFDGASSRVYSQSPVPAEFSMGGEFTVEWWVKISDQNNHTMISYRTPGDADEFAVGVMQWSSGTMRFRWAHNNETGVAYSEAVIADDQWHHCAVSYTSGHLRFYIDGSFAIEADPTGSLESGGKFMLGQLQSGQEGEWNSAYSLQGVLDEVRIWDSVLDQPTISANRFNKLSGSEAGLLHYWPLDAGSGGGAADLTGHGADGKAYAAGWTSAGAPVAAIVQTDLDGNYAMGGIRYGQATTFAVIPSGPSRTFDPTYTNITLDENSPIQNEIEFNDITAFALSGIIDIADTGCMNLGVEIYLDGNLAGVSAADGSYTISAQAGDHVLSVQKGTNTFSPVNYELLATGDIAGLNFSNTTTSILSGFVGGSCNLSVGTLRFRVATEDGCLEEFLEADGTYSLQLPSQEYIVSYEGVVGSPVEGISEAQLLAYFQSQGTHRIDLTDGDAELDLLFRAPLSMTIEGFPDAACAFFNDTETTAVSVGAPIIAQLAEVPLTISVYERYGDFTCPVDSGTVTIYDEIMDVTDTPTVLDIVDGQVTYTTIGNLPNIYAGRLDDDGNDRSYQKPISFVAEVPGQDLYTRTEWAMVTGDKPRIGTFVSAVSEELPMLILRDPPGDGSTAFLEEGKTFTYGFEGSVLESISGGVELAVEAGFEFTAGSMFFTTDSDAGVESSLGFEIGVSATATGGVEFSVTTTETFSTSDEQVFVGDGADLMLGVALNLLFAKTDVLGYDPDDCQIVHSQKVRFGADGDKPFETIYLYTTGHIEGNLIPQLRDLAKLAPADSVYFEGAARNWENLIVLNDDLRTEALQNVNENRSFSAGAEFGYTHESTESQSFSWEIGVYSEMEASTEIGFKVAGSGASATLTSTLRFEASFGGSVEEETVLTTGYMLSDDDPGDYFSIDVATDPVYGTPVFATRSGRSSCPWEAETQPRDGVILATADNTASNVPPDDLAEFAISIVNDSQSDEAREYQLRAVQTTNPGGAILRVNGSLLDQGLSYFIEPGATQMATLTVERGPSNFTYEDLRLMAVAPCEYELWEAGGTLAVSDTLEIDVYFDSPCTDISLMDPGPGWVFNESSSTLYGDSLKMMLDEFSLNMNEDETITHIGGEYREVGTELWTEIDKVLMEDIPLYPVDHLLAGEPMSVNVYWDVKPPFNDGVYELCAFSYCENGGRVRSQAVRGILDREDPEILSLEPADEVLALGDQIIINFNEEIDCETVNGTTVLVKIEEIGDDTPVTSSLVCNGTSVIITPTSPVIGLMEGKTLIASVAGVKDIAGNTLDGTTTWSFEVRRSEFTWSSSSIYKDAAYSDPGTMSGTLVNGSDEDLTFSLNDLPEWLTTYTMGGTVIAGQDLEIEFAIADTLSIGSYVDSLTADVPSEGLSAQLRVRVDVGCQPPAWAVNPADYQHSMTAIIELSIDGAISTDESDVVAAFVGNEVRGVAYLDSIVDLSPVRVLAFMNIYSNRLGGENVRFKVYNDDACFLYNSTDNYLLFESDRRYGTPEVPITMTALDLPAGDLQSISMNSGWTWFSLNLVDSLDMSVVTILGDLNPEPGDAIKTVRGTIGYVSTYDASLGWTGSLSDLSTKETYAIYLSEAGTILHEGQPASLDEAIQLNDGWNWIGYPVSDPLDVDYALSSLNFVNGDLLKSQSEFEEYVPNIPGWVGSLGMMEPGLGYKLYVDNAVVAGIDLIYPDPIPNPAPPLVAWTGTTSTAGKVRRLAAKSEVMQRERAQAAAASNGDRGDRFGNLPDWTLDHGYQFDMTMTALVQVDDESGGANAGILSAFVGDEPRGYTELIHVGPLGRNYAFIMAQSDIVEGETVTFRFYDAASDQVFDIEESLTFNADWMHGTLNEPIVLHANSSVVAGLPTRFSLSRAYPNPVVGSSPSLVSWSIPQSTHVSLKVYDVRGRLVSTVVDNVMNSGSYTVPIDTHEMPSGIYLYRMQAGDFNKTRKFLVVK